MKNLFSILMFSLIGLCVVACILLIIVIINTGDNFSVNKVFKSKNNFMAQPTHNDSNVVENNDDILNPDRLDTLNHHNSGTSLSSTNSTTASLNAEVSPSPSLKYQRFLPHYSCRQMITPANLRQLLLDNMFYCQKSSWSKEWANPGGKGIRAASEGLLLQDSTVVDSLTQVMWQRFSTNPALPFSKTDSVISYLNKVRWQGFDNWRVPKVEELMATLLPYKNSAGLFLPPGWDCNAQNIWSCNFACDSLSVQWVWVVRTSLGRCNVGHPATPRTLLAVRSL